MSGLDPIGRAKIADLIFELKTKGKTILFCSHILEDVDRLADEILILHKGKVRFFGSQVDLNNRCGTDNLTKCFLEIIGE